MIAGRLEDLKKYSKIVPFVGEIMEYIKKREFISYGKWHIINERLKVIYLNDWNREHALFEIHENFLDLHYTIRGTDLFSLCLGREKTILKKEYDPVLDYALVESTKEIEIMLISESWILVSPNEPHRNQFVENDTEKLVFKIAIG